MNKSLSTLAAALALAGLAVSAHAAKDVVVAVQSNFTTTDPYDANDTLSQAVAKSFYQGLYGFDKSLKMVPVLADKVDITRNFWLVAPAEKRELARIKALWDYLRRVAELNHSFLMGQSQTIQWIP